MSLNYKGRKPLWGKGINDADYLTQKVEKVNGKSRKVWVCPFYTVWSSLVRRCYSEVYQEKQSTYKDCSLCEDWHYFSKFKLWMENQDWEGKALDKDILKSGNSVYSPDTCVFVTQRLNNFFLDNKTLKKSTLPLGVGKTENGKYKARLSKIKRVYLGTFKTPEEAHKAWQVAKLKYGRELLQEQTDSRVIEGLTKILDNLEQDIQNNRITEKLV